MVTAVAADDIKRVGIAAFGPANGVKGRGRPLICRGGRGRATARLPHIGPGPDVRVALRRDLGRAAIWTRPRAEGRNLLVATTTSSRGRARSPPGDWPANCGPN